MRKRLPPTLATLALAALLPACSDSTSRTLGLVRDAPDEFQVTTRAPLSMPPDMTTLPSPSPGSPRPQERSARQQAEALLSPGLALQDPRRSPTTRPSVGEAALLQRAPSAIKRWESTSSPSRASGIPAPTRAKHQTNPRIQRPFHATTDPQTPHACAAGAWQRWQ